jgi:hypothetical protein
MGEYKSGDNIPLCYTRIRNGAVVTGLTVTVTVQNALTGATLLASTALTEVTPGLYSYNWVAGITTQTECIATYSTSGGIFKEAFTIDDEIKQLLAEAGRTS